MNCEVCPVKKSDSCLGRLHPKLCGDIRSGVPGRAAQLVMLATGKPMFAPRSTDGRKPRAGLISPCLVLGGAETHQLAVVQSTSDAIDWVGCAVTMGNLTDRSSHDLIAARMPVGFGEDAARILAQSCDVILTWADLDYRKLFAGIADPPRVVYVQHLDRGGSPTRGVHYHVAVSESARRCTPSPARTKVIPNAVDPARLIPTRSRSEVRRSWRVDEGAKVVGYLGRLEPEKDALVCGGVADCLPDNFRMVVVGDGSLRRELENHAAVSPRLRIVGPDPNVGSVLSAFDVLIVPSLRESFGLTIAEGWAAGIPVISTTVGIAAEHPELVRRIPIGGDVAMIRAAILADLHDTDKSTTRRVAAAWRWATENLSIGRFGKAWSDLLISIAPGSALRRVRNCPDRTPPACGCDSEPARCGQGKGVRGLVWLPDCLKCKEDRE